MIKRTLYFGNPANIRLKDKQLVADVFLENETKQVSVAVEDIGIVIADHQQITFSLGVIQALQENNAALITCDQRHMPQSLLLPLEGHSTQQERFEAQLNASVPLKKQLWAQTIEYKIKNQQKHLEVIGINADYLIPLHRNIKRSNCRCILLANAV